MGARAPLAMKARLALFGPAQRIQLLAPLSLTETRAFVDARRALAERERDDDLHRIFDANCREFDDLFAVVTKALKENRISEAHLVTVHAEADRRMINVLTAMRTLTDHWQTKLSGRHGSDSVQVDAFKRASSQEYDRHFAYRFLCRLRNYAQHCGLPIGQIRLQSRSRVILLDPRGGPSRPMKDPTRPRDQVVFLIDRTALLKEFDGWSTVRAELEKRHGQIDVAVNLRAVRSCVDRIHRRARALGALRARVHARYLRALMERVRVDDFRRLPVVYDASKFDGHRKLKLIFHWFPLREMHDLMPNDEYIAQVLAASLPHSSHTGNMTEG
jgi:hypothetical protein